MGTTLVEKKTVCVASKMVGDTEMECVQVDCDGEHHYMMARG